MPRPDTTLPDAGGLSDHGRRAARNILWSGWSQFGVAVVGVVWLFTIPRTLGPEQYGVFILLNSLLDFHALGCTLGVQNAFGYYFPSLRPSHPAALRRLATGYSLVVMALSLVAALLVGWLGMRLGGAPVTVLLAGLTALTAVLQAGNSICGAVLYGENRIALHAGRFALQQAVTTGLVFVGAWWYGLQGSVVGQTVAGAVVLAWLLAMARPWRYRSRATLPGAEPTAATSAPETPPAPTNLRGAIVFGVLSLFGSLATLTITRGGNIILAGVGRSTQEVAVYAVGVSFVLQGVMLLSAFGVALTPGLASLLAAGETERASDWARRATKYQMFLALAAVGFVVLLGHDLLRAAVGERFAGVYPTMVISAMALVPMAQSSLANQMAVAWGRPRVNLESWVLMSLLFLSGAAIYGLLRGPQGAAVALVVTAWLTAGFVNWRLAAAGGPRLLSWPLLKLLLIALPGFAAVLLHGPPAVNVALFGGFVGYLFLGALWCRAVRPNEITEVVTALRQRTG